MTFISMCTFDLNTQKKFNVMGQRWAYNNNARKLNTPKSHTPLKNIKCIAQLHKNYSK